MSLFPPFSKSSTLKAAIKHVAEARNSEGGKADQLYKSAYQGFAKVVAGDAVLADALHNWGFAQLHHAKNKGKDEAIGLYEDAVNKFTFCLLASPNHLGGAIDGGFAYMELARLNNAQPEDPLYDKAIEFFEKAGHIQKGSAAYNLACIHALRDDHEACRAALELAKECGSLPDEQDVMNDPDMAPVKDAQWFHEFLGSVAVKLAEAAENDRRTRRGLKKVDEVKLDLPPRPTDSTLRRHYDTMIAAEIDRQREALKAKQEREAEEKAKKKKGDKFDYYK
ncbi:hypothetical protein Q9L42_019885 [Methylomarinum sp. Ch1-1]|uniref:Uncharacterized protein n=1 Tax=Methylomarinum roseum TaxID=3067653 RepID=A0AAU7NUD0_9GAMM|nr:hypothetical protein [Methylomarinum sp. Ch1-1]MDP4519343.1 hypothetical protein [Methylomarinum sp. Ch1-1]